MDFNSMLSNLKREASTATHSAKRAKTLSASANEAIPTSSSTSHAHAQAEDDLQLIFPTEKVHEIYLVCPPNVQTGGPEAMHQLCHKINSLGSAKVNNNNDKSVTAFMLYMEERNGKARHVRNAMPLEAYDIYTHVKVANNSWNENDYENDIPVKEDEGDSKDGRMKNRCLYSNKLIVWPEIWTNLMDTITIQDEEDLQKKKCRHQHAIWWLSVNNNNGKFKGEQWQDRGDILHLYQSQYAKNHILKNLNTHKHKHKHKCKEESDGEKKNPHDLCVLPMTEFIAAQRTRTSASASTSTVRRDLQILYNPLKGIHYTDEIRKRAGKKLQFEPIGGRNKRLSPAEVTKLLHRAKVYIDFGPHPGMDRLPREAALADCIVITNKEGAAFYEKDVPIPNVYKVGEFDVDRVHKVLMDSVEKYEEKRRDFDGYRNWIGGQEKVMDTCVQNLIDSVHKKRDR